MSGNLSLTTWRAPNRSRKTPLPTITGTVRLQVETE